MNFQEIAKIESCFVDKFGVPRQPGLVPAAEAWVQFPPVEVYRQALSGIHEFTHIWIIFVFHLNDPNHWKVTVRPPRLGGAKKVGVLASRSPHRPNPIGISVFPLLAVELDAPSGPRLRIGGVDLVNGTPVLDVKPYVPYCDSIPHAGSGWAQGTIRRHPVLWNELSAQQLIELSDEDLRPQLKEMIVQLLSLDPRPAFQSRKIPIGEESSLGRIFGFRLYDLDIKWRILGHGFEIIELNRLE